MVPPSAARFSPELQTGGRWLVNPPQPHHTLLACFDHLSVDLREQSVLNPFGGNRDGPELCEALHSLPKDWRKRSASRFSFASLACLRRALPSFAPEIRRLRRST
jgi:hypothetical protein